MAQKNPKNARIADGTDHTKTLAHESIVVSVNVGFNGGHVQPVRLDALWRLYWHVDYRPPASVPNRRDVEPRGGFTVPRLPARDETGELW